jgi:hypothetical protein
VPPYFFANNGSFERLKNQHKTTMVTFAEPPKATAHDGGNAISSSSDGSISEIIYSHFDAYQRDSDSGGGGKNVSRAAEALHHDILSFVLSSSNSDNTDVSEEIASTLKRCIDAAMSCIVSSAKKDIWSESVTAILELGAAYACCYAGKNGSDSEQQQLVAETVIHRAIEFLTVERDTVRTESCNMLGWCVRYLMESSKPAVSILKKKGKAAAVTDTNKSNTSDVAGWKVECLVEIGKALQPRLTDKIAKVRSAAISACAPFFNVAASDVSGAMKSNNYDKMIKSIQTILMSIMTNDSSAPNRALVSQIIVRNTSTASLENSEDIISHIIERVKDVDVKVREAALDSLRENVNVDDLTEDQRVEILRYGLTKRYVPDLFVFLTIPSSYCQQQTYINSLL